eukprot:14133329-Ditylum_brightwellii.AAC.1
MKSLPVAIVTSVGDILKEEELGAIRPRGRRDGSRGGSQTAQSLHPSETLPGPELLGQEQRLEEERYVPTRVVAVDQPLNNAECREEPRHVEGEGVKEGLTGSAPGLLMGLTARRGLGVFRRGVLEL